MSDFAGAELDRVMGSDTVATWNSRRGSGGEWDAIRALPLRTRQRLTSAGYFAYRGMMPDVAAEVICRQVGGIDDIDAAMNWYISMSRLALCERRRIRHYARHFTVAVLGGDANYYDRRVRLARQAGHTSLWQYRKALGWEENRTPRWKPKKAA